MMNEIEYQNYKAIDLVVDNLLRIKYGNKVTLGDLICCANENIDRGYVVICQKLGDDCMSEWERGVLETRLSYCEDMRVALSIDEDIEIYRNKEFDTYMDEQYEKMIRMCDGGSGYISDVEK